MISEDFITDTPIRIYALARGVRIVTLSAMPLVNRIWIMRSRNSRPGADLNANGNPKHRCGGMSKIEKEERRLHGDTRIGND